MDDLVENSTEEEVTVAPDNSIEDVKEEEHQPDLETEVGERRWPGWPGENVFRILVPAQKVGGLIGRKGEYIKRMCEESRARIKILDGPPGVTERAVLSADIRNKSNHPCEFK